MVLSLFLGLFLFFMFFLLCYIRIGDTVKLFGGFSMVHIDLSEFKKGFFLVHLGK